MDHRFVLNESVFKKRLQNFPGHFCFWRHRLKLSCFSREMDFQTKVNLPFELFFHVLLWITLLKKLFFPEKFTFQPCIQTLFLHVSVAWSNYPTISLHFFCNHFQLYLIHYIFIYNYPIDMKLIWLSPFNNDTFNYLIDALIYIFVWPMIFDFNLQWWHI